MGKKMNVGVFWDLIQKAKFRYEYNQSGFCDFIRYKLLELDPEDILMYEAIMKTHMNAAYKYGLWTAACVMMGGCSDDGFTDFRAWLVSKGKDVYMDALRDPNTLSMTGYDEPYDFEAFGYLGGEVYQEKTGKYLSHTDLRKYVDETEQVILPGIQYHRLIEYPFEMEDAEKAFPVLYKKFAGAKAVNGSMWNTQHEDICRLLEEGRVAIKEGGA